ncbi:MAG: NAD(P)-binding domain-containing protein [bacterium]|nr:NAD(P)-binding domain-containing protein [Candidatus Sumerlaeota bacterium]
MKIGILGSGKMGGGLGKVWAERGHSVMFSFTLEHDNLKTLADSLKPNACVGTPREAADFGDVIFFAPQWAQVEEALMQAGPLTGKIVIECVNAVKPDLSGPLLSAGTSASEEIARMAIGARVLKAFNTIPASHIDAHPPFMRGQTETVFYCGDDNEAKAVTARLIRDAGFDAVDAGPLKSARCLESLSLLLIELIVFQKVAPDAAVKLLY